jgi:hypothetical protein
MWPKPPPRLSFGHDWAIDQSSWFPARAIFFCPTQKKGDGKEALHSIPKEKTPCQPTPHPILCLASFAHRKTPIARSARPRWAAGLCDAEILIGTQNTDPETMSGGEHST